MLARRRTSARRAAPLTLVAVAAACSLHAVAASTGLAAGMGAGVRAGIAPPAPGSGDWTAPRVLARCAVAGAPQVVFPTEAATRPIGDGAISWLSDPAPCGSRSGGWGASVAVLGSADTASPTGVQALGGQHGMPLAAVASTRGQIALAAGSGAAGSEVGLVQGFARDRSAWARIRVGAGPPIALGRGYLGDVALAAVAHGPSIAVRVERFFESRFEQARSIPIGAGAVTALAVGMDYRADVLLVWQQDQAIYACLLRASGGTGPRQRIGSSAAYPQIQAVVSDNEHGIIAWSSTDLSSASRPVTRTYLSLSKAGVRFLPPRELASFADPQLLGRRPGSIALERLSTENVMLAWTVSEGGRYLVRAAPAVFASSTHSTIISEPRSQSILADLAPGPAGEAVALWSTAPPLADGALNMRRAELWAARTRIEPHAVVARAGSRMIAAAGPNTAPAVAVDPANDRAVAAWLTLGARQRIEYAVGAGSADYRPRPQVAAAGLPPARTHRLRIILVVAAAAVAAALIAAIIGARRLRRPQRREGGRPA